MKFSKLLLALSFSVAVGAASAGVVVIDTFNVGGPQLTQSTVGTSSLVGSSCGTECIGGVREMQVTKHGPSSVSDALGDVRFKVENGKLQYSADNETTGTAYIRWDGSADGQRGYGLNANLSGFSSLDILTPFSDGNFRYTLTFWTDQTHFSSVTGRAASVGMNGPVDGYVFPKNYVFTFDRAMFEAAGYTEASPANILVGPFEGSNTNFYIDGYCGNQCADFSNIGAITALIDPQGERPSLDLSINNVNLVPEPGSLALMVGGLFALGSVLRRKAK